MKNLLKFTSLVLVISLSIASCSKDELISENDTKSKQVIENYQKLSEVEFKEITDNFTSNYAQFESEGAFYAFLNYYNKLSESRQQAILEKLPYTTFDKQLSQAYEGMEALETEQQFYDYVSNYADFLEISITEDGEKEVIEKEISLHSIAPFLNTDRIIQIKDTYQKFIGNIAIESGDYNELKKVTDSKKVSGLEYKEVYQIISGVNDAMAKTHVGTILSWEAMKDQSGCKNDRKAILAAYFVDESFTIFGVNIIQIRPQINVIARRKGIPCIWYDYQTNITWNNFYVEYSIDFAPNVVWTEADQTIYASSITRPHDLIDFSDSPDVTWKRIKSNVTTTGLGTSSLTVDF